MLVYNASHVFRNTSIKREGNYVYNTSIWILMLRNKCNIFTIHSTQWTYPN